MYPKELKTGFSINNKNLHMKVYSSTIHNSPKLEKTQMSIDWWIGQKNVAISVQGNIIHTWKGMRPCYIWQYG